MNGARFLKLGLCVFAAFHAGVSALSPETALRAEAAPARGKLSAPARAETFLPAPLPKKGNIAVLVKGVSEHHNNAVVALVSQRLAAKGYKVVDSQKLANIRKSKAAMAALDGNVDAIIKINSQYQVGTTITISAQAGQPVENEFGLQTGTASAAVTAVSGSSVVYSDTVQGKQLGYTPDEAAQKSIEAAALLAVERMTR
jgi:hypothetical protein